MDCTCHDKTAPAPAGPVVLRRTWPTSQARLKDTEELIEAYAERPELRMWVAEILDQRGIGDASTDDLILAVGEFVRDHVAYLPERGEVLQTPASTWTSRRGDCDDQAILACALLRSVGIEARPIYWHNTPTAPAHHIAVQAIDQEGKPVHFDPTEPQAVGWMPLGFFWSYDGAGPAQPVAGWFSDATGWVSDQISAGWDEVSGFFEGLWADLRSPEFWEDLMWAVAGCVETYFTGQYPVGTSVARRVVDEDTPDDFYNPAASSEQGAAAGAEANVQGAACGAEVKRAFTRRASVQRLQQLGEEVSNASIADMERRMRQELGDAYEQGIAEVRDQVVSMPEFQSVIADALAIALEYVQGATIGEIQGAVQAQIAKQRPAVVARWLDRQGFEPARIDQGEYPSDLIWTAIGAGGWYSTAPATIIDDVIDSALSGRPFRGFDPGGLNNEQAALNAVNREVDRMARMGQIQHFNRPTQPQDDSIAYGQAIEQAQELMRRQQQAELAVKWAPAIARTINMIPAMDGTYTIEAPTIQGQIVPGALEQAQQGAAGPGLGSIRDQSSGELLGGVNKSTLAGLAIGAALIFYFMGRK